VRKRRIKILKLTAQRTGHDPIRTRQATRLSKTNSKGLARGQCLFRHGRHNLRLTKESIHP
jgi:hypothetical protein